MAQEVFRRKETKYLLSPSEQQQLLDKIDVYLEKDRYFKGTNLSIYFDTPDWHLLERSLDKPLYKEKIRLRSYGVPKLDDIVFLEIKKKLKGIGSKRRIPVKLQDFYHFLATGGLISDNPQIIAEANYCFKHYDLQPRIMIAYDRHSYYYKDDPHFRLTFDRNIRSRLTDLKLEHGDHGQPYFKNGEIVMEVKALGGYPLWFVQALNQLNLRPASFSKYGRIAPAQIQHTNTIIYQKEKAYV